MAKIRLPITPDSTGCWAIRALGEVRPSCEPDARVIKVYLSKLDLRSGAPRTIENEFSFEKESRLKPEVKWAPVGVFPALKIGSIWKDTEKVGDLPGKEYSFDIDPAVNHSYILPIKGKGVSLIPCEYWGYQLPEDAQEIKCLVITTGNKERLIIPCTEIARYYFFRTSNLADKIINDWISYPSSNIDEGQDALFDIRQSEPVVESCNNGIVVTRCYIKLRRGAKISGDKQYNDAWVAARIRYEPKFKASVRKMLSRLKLSFINGAERPGMISVEWPVGVITTLRVIGKKFNHAGVEKIFATRILNCSAQLIDGMQLEYSVDNEPGISGCNDFDKASAFSGLKKMHPNRQGDAPDKGECARDNKPPLVTADNAEHLWRYDDLEEQDEGFNTTNQIPKRRPPKLATTVSREFGGSIPLTDLVSTNPGWQSGSCAAKTNIYMNDDGGEAQEHKRPIPADFESTLALLKYFENDRGFKTNWVTGEESALDPCGDACYLPTAPSREMFSGNQEELRRITAWARMRSPKSSLQNAPRRRVWIAKIQKISNNPTTRDKVIYLLEVEKREDKKENYRALVFHRPDFGVVEAATIYGLAEQIIIHQKVVADFDVFRDVVRHTYVHGRTEYSSYCDKIIGLTGIE